MLHAENFPLDVLFVLDQMQSLGRKESATVWGGMIDASQTGIVGYSMGGYGVVNVIGGGYTDTSAAANNAPPNKMLMARGASNPAYQEARDPRIKAAIAIGPWGMQGGFWDAEGLKGITTPLLFVAGSADLVAGYEKGTRALYMGAVNADRYLLTFINAGHNAAAPYPLPVELEAVTDSAYPRATSPFGHYADAVWDTTRMNNILQHFATAFFDLHLKGEREKQAFLDLAPNGKDGTWKGFKRGTAVGLMLEHTPPSPR